MIETAAPALAHHMPLFLTALISRYQEWRFWRAVRLLESRDVKAVPASDLRQMMETVEAYRLLMIRTHKGTRGVHMSVKKARAIVGTVDRYRDWMPPN